MLLMSSALMLALTPPAKTNVRLSIIAQVQAGDGEFVVEECGNSL